ncbi:ATP-dependent DNA helicase, partial [Candidatus Woesearchaeota archaeon]|nr:ATP-dependent DNA helicase [Candidatus Woesearchaeota archaeon]
ELKNDECHESLNRLEYWIKELIMDLDEVIVKQGEFDPGKFTEAIELFEKLAERTREDNKRSYLGTIANFLMKYTDEEGYINIIRKNYERKHIEFKHSCLDPSLIARPILNNAYSSIVMSGTLEPIDMFKEILGLKGEHFEFPSPFPARNKLNLIVPETTTKYSERSVDQYNHIASNLAKMCNKIPGNTIIFFPSYYIRDQIYNAFSELCEKTTFNEVPKMSKEEKDSLLKRFKSYKEHGAVLLAAASGSFGEGVDLPGNLLKGVIVVGLPLNKPTLETSSLINYYNQKYPGKGWDYGYTLPAFAKILQNAGRCIRSETDKGVIIFMDKRFSWGNYKKCFSEDYSVSLDFEEKIKKFFEKHE